MWWCYQTKFGSTRPCALKPIYWHQVVGEGKYSIYCRCQARRTGRSCSEDSNSLMAFRGRVLKAVRGRVLQGAWSARIQFSDWLASRWSFEHCLSTSLGSTCLWSAVFIWRGSAFCKNNLGMCVRPLSFRELWIQWFCYVADLQSKLFQFPSPTALLCFYIFTFLIVNSWVRLFETQGRPGRLKRKTFTSKDREAGACIQFQ